MSPVTFRPGALPAADREVSRLLREALDADTERGLVLLDAECRVVYLNSAARTLLAGEGPRGADTRLPLDVEQAARALLERARAERAPQAHELDWPRGEERSARIVLEATLREDAWYVLARLSRAQAWTEPTIRRLQARFQLTVREAQVAAGVARGQSNGEVATALGIVEKTVKNVLMVVYQKAGVRNRVELALRAYDVALPDRAT